MKSAAVIVFFLGLVWALPVWAQQSVEETAAKSQADSSVETSQKTGDAEKSAAVEGESTPDEPKDEGAETTAEERTPGLTADERLKLQKEQAVQYERENAETRIKQKAMEEAEKREAKKKQLLEEQERANTDIRRKAIERARERELEKQKKIEEQQNKQSLFFDKARRNAERREEKKRRQMQKVNRRRSKPITGVPLD